MIRQKLKAAAFAGSMLVLISASAAHAATYNIVLYSFDGTTELGSGTFDASGGLVSAANIVYNSFTYSLINPAPPNTSVPTYDPIGNDLDGRIYSSFTNLNNFRALVFSTNDWSLLFCSGSSTGPSSCGITRPSPYSINPVPIPAALPLFATGVAAVAYAGRRKRQAARAAA